MRYLKIVAVLAVAVTAIAMIGAAAASATTLCKANETTCGSPYAPGTVLEGAGSVRLIEEGNESTCSSHLTMSLPETSKSGGALSGSITKLTFGSCLGSCSSVAAANLPYSAELVAGSGGSGTTTIRSTNANLTYHCTKFGFPYTCTYSLENYGMTFEGGNPGRLAGKAHVHRVGTSVTCPEQQELAVSYTLSPSGTWLTGP